MNATHPDYSGLLRLAAVHNGRLPPKLDYLLVEAGAGLGIDESAVRQHVQRAVRVARAEQLRRNVRWFNGQRITEVQR